MDPTELSAPGDWWVICLCADWCNVCREWREPFEQLAKAQPDLHFAWIDVEDEDDAMGDVDIETFPTMLVAHDRQPRFFGPVLPSAPGLSRLLASLREGAAATAGAAEAAALLKRLAPIVLSKG